MMTNWQRYQEIEKIPKEYRTIKEEKFYKQMYMLEEIQAGLDGERGNFNRNFIDDNT